MPTLHVNDTQLHYIDTGVPGIDRGAPGAVSPAADRGASGAAPDGADRSPSEAAPDGADTDGDTIVFSHGLLWSAKMFEAQIEALRDRYRCVAYDHRGQGRSADHDGPSVPIELNYADAVALIEALDLAPVHFVGLSMGGFVGLRLGARRPDLLRSLILMETSAAAEPAESVASYRRLNAVVRLLGGVGIRLVAGKVMPILFGETFLNDPARAPERQRWKAELTANRRRIHKAVTGVLERDGVEHLLADITVPTLVVVGDEDVATPPQRAEAIAEGIPGAILERIPNAGHSSTVEQPDAVSDTIARFLAAGGDQA